MKNTYNRATVKYLLSCVPKEEIKETLSDEFKHLAETNIYCSKKGEIYAYYEGMGYIDALKYLRNISRDKVFFENITHLYTKEPGYLILRTFTPRHLWKNQIFYKDGNKENLSLDNLSFSSFQRDPIVRKTKLSGYVEKLPSDAKETYIENIYITPDAEVYYFDTENEVYRKTNKASKYRVRGESTKECVYVCETSYMKHKLFAEAFVENPYKDKVSLTKLVAVALDGNYSNYSKENFEWMTLTEYTKKYTLKKYDKCPICGHTIIIKGNKYCIKCQREMDRTKAAWETQYQEHVEKVAFIRKYIHKFTPQQERDLSLYEKGNSIADIARITNTSRQNISSRFLSMFDKATEIKAYRKAFGMSDDE